MNIMNNQELRAPKSRELFDCGISLDNFLLYTDSYKYSHPFQMPKGTEHDFRYIEPRKACDEIDYTIFFGLQMELADLQGEGIVTQTMLNQAAPYIKKHGLNLHLQKWQRVIDKHKGALAIKIDALPEGTITPIGIPQMRIQNTDPGVDHLPGFLEGRLLQAAWYPSTVATFSNYMTKEIRRRMAITDRDTAGAEFKLHDFGFRAVEVKEAAGRGGAAHLLNSLGTDTSPGLLYASAFYGAEMAGHSCPATEHATVTPYGRYGELTALEKFMIDNPDGLISFVSDSYDLWELVKNIGTKLKDKVMARNGVLVIRPDSGEPTEIVPAVIEALMSYFGYYYTPNGYRVLNDKIRVIQGDRVDRKSIVQIMAAMEDRKLSISNAAFGMGSGLLQDVNRDSFGYTMKSSAVCVNGEWRDVFKDPATAKGTKTSKKGRIGVMINDSGKMVARRMENIPAGKDGLENVFENGKITKLQTFDEIRARVGLIK